MGDVIPFSLSRPAAIAEDKQADGIYRPRFLPERQSWICERYLRSDGKLSVETYGARLNGPLGPRFSPLFLLNETDAQAQCDMLNGANDG